MRRKIFSLIIVMTLAVGNCCVAMAAAPEVDAMEQREDGGIGISVNGSTIVVTGAEGAVLEVVSLTGRKVATIKIESPSQRVELNIAKGCYILKIGKVVRKVSIS